MMFAFIGAFILMVLSFVISVASGAARGMDDVSPVTPLGAVLVAMLLLVLQAVLWVGLGMQMGGA